MKNDPTLGKQATITLDRYIDPDQAKKLRFLVFCDVTNGKVDAYSGRAFRSDSKVVEYDQDWKVLWEYTDAPSVWAAVRLKNGNTLISGNQHKYVREISPDKKVVWELTQADVRGECRQFDQCSQCLLPRVRSHGSTSPILG